MATKNSLPKANVADLSMLYDDLARVGTSETSKPPTPGIEPARLDMMVAERLRPDDFMPHEIEKIETIISKGAKLQLMMVSDDITAGNMMDPPRTSAVSHLEDFHDFEKSRYIEITDASSSQWLSAWLRRKEVGTALSQIGFGPAISSAPNNDGSAPVHHECYLAECSSLDRTYHCDAVAHFMQVVNPRAGLIVACDNASPAAADSMHGRNGGSLPDLRFWSDVAFLQWKSRAAMFGLTKNLKYVLRYQVMNHATNLAVAAINEINGTKKLQWPGITYDSASVEGNALLGTPTGSSIAYLLNVHPCVAGHPA
ncbi:hypothetical protein BKA63DRAFT_551841 [Paraphoma chrysanthemicola]|nr:hypothetical protein BKA63DRAFT_551841 [Paraphoma chrysanthemicola]